MKKWTQRKPVETPSKWDTVVEKIAKTRGLQDVDRFLNPTKAELHDPYLLKNIEEACSRIAFAIENGEQIVVSYDPDADGVCSASTSLRILKRYGVPVDYIYGERGDGHGIEKMIQEIKTDKDKEPSERAVRNQENVEKLKAADLILLVDSSSNDAEACRIMKEEWGKDIIILDHHSIEQDNPHVILVNPQQAGCKYPNKQLSAAGIVLKTFQVLQDYVDDAVDPFDYIDLVAVGMYADVMRVDVLENRYLIMEGMRNMKNTGLVRIIKSGKGDPRKVNSSTIGFTIQPLLNGVARMDNLKLAIDMMLEDDDKVCQGIQRKMKKLNEERKSRQKSLTNQYETRIDASEKILIVIDEQSSKGFNGMIAQQLSERFKRPAIVGRKHKGVISGSFRTFGEFPLKDFLRGFGNIKTMGHPEAGGIEVNEADFDGLKKYINDNLPELNTGPQTLEYDLEIDVDDVLQYIKPMEQFNLLCGNGFEKIMVRIEGISVDDIVTLGANEDTRKISTFEGVELIRFRVSKEYADELGPFDNISAIGQLQMNEFYHNGVKKWIRTPQLILEDYKLR